MDLLLIVLSRKIIQKKSKKKKGSLEVCTDYEHQRAKGYLTLELKQLLNSNKTDCIQTFLKGLTPTESTDYSLGRWPRK
jgi:hypothetical protein